MQNIKRSMATGLATGVIALGAAGMVQAASITTILNGNLGLAINVDASDPMNVEYPYAVYTKESANPDYTQYPALPVTLPVSNPTTLPGFGSNSFTFVTDPALDPTAPVAPGWRLETRIEGDLFFTDRFAGIPGRADPNWVDRTEDFSVGFSVDYGAGLSANQLAGDAMNAVDFFSAFWQATLFQVSQVDAGDSSGNLFFGPFSRIGQLYPSVAGMANDDNLVWNFDVTTKDGTSPVLTALGDFRFALQGPQGIDSLNTLWAAAGFGDPDSFSAAQANMVPTGMQYTMTMTLTAIPLPAGMPLMLGALGLLGFAGWKRRRARAA